MGMGRGTGGWGLWWLLALVGQSFASVRLANDRISLLFAEAEDGFALLDMRGPHLAYLLPHPHPVLWTLTLQSGETITSRAACQKRSYARASNATHDVLRFSWNGLGHPGDAPASSDLQVELEVALPFSESITLWTAAVHTLTVPLAQFEYSPLQAVGTRSQMEDHLLIPHGFGQQFTAPGRTLAPFTAAYPSAACPVQLFAWWHTGTPACRTEGCGLYFAAHDPTGSAKSFRYNTTAGVGLPGGTVLAVSVPLLDAGIPGRQRLPAFPVAVGVFAGDWWDAAQLYRRWAIASAGWMRAGDLRSRVASGALPADLLTAGLWVNTGWRSADVLDPHQGDPAVVVEAVRQLTGALGLGVPINVHWYVWHQNHSFDAGYPDLLPPKPGFAEALQQLRQWDVRVFPYVNGRLFDVSLPLWKEDHAEEFATHWHGELNLEEYGNGVKFAAMCPATAYWQGKVSALVTDLLDHYGVDGVYVDQLGSHPPAPCDAAAHPHPRAGGDHWVAGYRAMLGRIPAGRVLVEGNAEPFLDLVAGQLTLAGYANATVGGYGAIYGGYAVPVGSVFHPTELTDDPTVFQAHVTRQLVLGAALGWLPLAAADGVLPGLLLPAHRPQLAFLRDAALFRQRGANFLVFGRMLRPLPLRGVVPTIHARDPFNGAVDYAAVQSSAWLDETSDTSPAVLLLLVNAYHGPLDVGFSVDPLQYELRSRHSRYCLVHWPLDAAPQPLGHFIRRVSLDVTLQPRQILWLELRPAELAEGEAWPWWLRGFALTLLAAVAGLGWLLTRHWCGRPRDGDAEEDQPVMQLDPDFNCALENSDEERFL